MRKIVTRSLMGLFAAGLLFATVSCKKCRECWAYDDYGYSYISYYEEYCATGFNASNKVSDWEDDFRSTWSGYYIECNDVK